MADVMYFVGPLQIEAGYRPLNATAVDDEVSGSYAEKNVLGRRPPLEATGEGPETMTIRGTVLPFKLGGLSELELARQIVTSQREVSVFRGDGYWHGFYVIEKMPRAGTFLHPSGIGQVIGYEFHLKRADAPQASDFFDDILSLLP